MTKERLRRYRDLKREEQQLREQLAGIEAALYYPKAQKLTDMPTGPRDGHSALEDMVATHLELLDLYKGKQAELAAEILAIEEAINSLEPVERSLMRYHYISGLKWEEVCVRINYSWRQTHRLHAAALEKLKEPGE